MTSVSIKDLTKGYGKVEAIKNVNLEIKNKEFFVLLGPSGCGKTTLLLCIAGLLKPDKGEIWLGDRLVSSAKQFIPPQERMISMVFQDYALYPHLTVFKNIAFPLEIKKVSTQEIEQKVKSIAKFLGISHLLDRKPGQLSGGERQRVALARALIKEPELLLMDEPLANLDAKIRVYMRAELKKLQRSLGTTIVYVTHDQVEAMSMADRVGVMSAGTLQQVASPTELYDHPGNTFVAGFIGSPPMNMFYGNLTKKGDYTIIDTESFKFKLPPQIKEIVGVSNFSEVVLGIRPEHVMLSNKSGENVFQAKVIHVELLGRELNVHLMIGNKEIVMVTKPETELKVGDEVKITFDENKVYLFDKKTGKLIV